MTNAKSSFLRASVLSIAAIGMVGCSSSNPLAFHSPFKQKLEAVRTTAYSHHEADSLPYGRSNAAGGTLKYGQVRSAAADWSRYPVGTLFKITGDQHVYEIDDYGSALVGTDTIDLYKPTLGMMNQWGVRHVDIEVLRWGSFAQSADILKDRTRAAHVRKMLAEIRTKKTI